LCGATARPNKPEAAKHSESDAQLASTMAETGSERGTAKRVPTGKRPMKNEWEGFK
jgi:hypothetical protein